MFINLQQTKSNMIHVIYRGGECDIFLIVAGINTLADRRETLTAREIGLRQHVSASQRDTNRLLFL